MRWTIRRRLALGCGLLMGAVVAAAGTFVYLRLQAHLRDAVDAGLRSRAEILLSQEHPDLSASGALIETDEAFVQILSPAGDVLASSPGVRSGALVDVDVGGGGSSGGGEIFDARVETAEETVPARVLAVRARDGRVIVVGASLDDSDEALGALLRAFLIGGPLAAALAAGIGWLVAGAALRPVETMRVEAEAVSAAEPGRRLPVAPSGDELTRLGETLNHMLDRLEQAVEAERRFVTDASHELRTPLANMRAEIELALRRSRTADEMLVALHSVGEEADRLTRLADDLLVLARANGGTLPVRRERVVLGDLVGDIVRPFADRAAQRQISIEQRGDSGRAANVDPLRIRQAVGNLLDNALRHTPNGGQVTIDVGGQDGNTVIEVRDSGPGFAPGFVGDAFEPFRRGDAGRARTDGGAGLGLTIVRAVVEAHGGTVEAANAPGGGALVVLRIPSRPCA